MLKRKRKRGELIIWNVIVIGLSSFLFLISNNQTTGLPITDRPQRLHAPKTCTELNDLSLSRHYQFISFILFPPFCSSADGCTGKSYQLTLKNKLRLMENNNKYMYVWRYVMYVCMSHSINAKKNVNGLLYYALSIAHGVKLNRIRVFTVRHNNVIGTRFKSDFHQGNEPINRLFRLSIEL